MDIGTHAAWIAQLCDASFAPLILEVPGRWKHGCDGAFTLVGTISHADKMAKICKPPAPVMIFELANKLLRAAEPRTLAMQDDAVHSLVQLVSQASSLAGIVPQVANDIFALARPLIDEPLPTTEDQVRRLRTRQQTIYGKMQSHCQQALMQRIVANW